MLELNTSSLEDWYPGQPEVIMRPVEVIEKYLYDGGFGAAWDAAKMEISRLQFEPCRPA